MKVHIADARFLLAMADNTVPVLTREDAAVLYGELNEAADRLRGPRPKRRLHDVHVVIRWEETRRQQRASVDATLTVSDGTVKIAVFKFLLGYHCFGVDLEGNLYQLRLLKGVAGYNEKCWFRVPDLRQALRDPRLLHDEMLPALRRLGA